MRGEVILGFTTSDFGAFIERVIHAGGRSVEPARILQRKIRNYKTPVYIDIQMGDEPKAAVNACLRSEIPCPY